jgi:hypothetical protein
MMRIFISSPVGGNYTGHLQLARRVFVALLAMHLHPVCPHLLLIEAVGFSDRDERLRVLGMDYALSELWSCTLCIIIKREDGTISQGCRAELKYCDEHRIPYRILEWPEFMMDKPRWELDDAKYYLPDIEEWYSKSE